MALMSFPRFTVYGSLLIIGIGFLFFPIDSIFPYFSEVFPFLENTPVLMWILDNSQNFIPFIIMFSGGYLLYFAYKELW